MRPARASAEPKKKCNKGLSGESIGHFVMWFDTPVLSAAEGLTTSGAQTLFRSY